MASQKLTLLVCASLALLATCSAASSKNQPHNLVVGSRVRGDRLLEGTLVVKDYKWFRVVKKELTFTGDGISNITMVNLIDQAKDGKGATATIVNGGPRFNFVTIKFKSQRSHTINFVVLIYGKR